MVISNFSTQIKGQLTPMMRKRTRGTFRRVRLLKTFLISLIQVLYFHFLFWLLNVIPKGRDTLHQKTQPLQDIRNI